MEHQRGYASWGWSKWADPCASCQCQARHVVNAKLGMHPSPTSQHALKSRLGRIGCILISCILLEGLLQIVLENSVETIILARVMEVGEHLFEFAEEPR